ATAHSSNLDLHAIGRNLERVRNDVLHLGWVLRRAVDEHAAVFTRESVGDLALEVELLLPADVELAADAVRRRGERTLGVTLGEAHRRQHVRGALLRLLRRQDRR